MGTSDSDSSEALWAPKTTAFEDAGLEARRVLLFVAFAFGISWAIGAIVYATGGIGPESPSVLPGVPLWAPLVAIGYMFGPALANVCTRIVTGEGRADLGLRPRFRRDWRWWAIAWLLPIALIYLGTALFFAFFPEYFDSSLSAVTQFPGATGAAGGSSALDPWTLVVLQAVSALTIGTAINCLLTFGEEFGWRAYLQPKLMPLGGRRAVLLTGAIWGIWHWPVILMGYNYPDAPVAGAVVMVLVTVVFGVVLGWVTIHTHSVWPAVIGHAAINANAGIGLLFAQGSPSSLLGPAPIGVIGLLPLAALALWLLVRPGALVSSGS